MWPIWLVIEQVTNWVFQSSAFSTGAPSGDTILMLTRRMVTRRLAKTRWRHQLKGVKNVNWHWVLLVKEQLKIVTHSFSVTIDYSNLQQGLSRRAIATITNNSGWMLSREELRGLNYYTSRAQTLMKLMMAMLWNRFYWRSMYYTSFLSKWEEDDQWILIMLWNIAHMHTQHGATAYEECDRALRADRHIHVRCQEYQAAWYSIIPSRMVQDNTDGVWFSVQWCCTWYRCASQLWEVSRESNVTMYDRQHQARWFLDY